MHNGGMATHTHDLFDEDKAAWLEDLQEGLLCLVLHSTSASLLNETSRTLQNLWVSAHAGHVESFDGAHCQDIIRRFNERVASYSASIAALPPDPDHPAHLWIVHQAQSLSADQVHLLGQMLVHLPGVNIRMVLLHEGSTPVGNWSEATQGQSDTHELVPLPAPAIDLLDLGADHPQDEDPIVDREESSPTEAPHRCTRRHWILAGAVGLAVFGLGFAAGRVTSPEPQGSQPVVADVAHIPPPTEPASAVVTTRSDANSATPSVQAPTPSAQATSAPTPLSTDAQWLRKLPSGSFVVVHDSFAELATAQAFKAKHAILKTARIVPVKLSDKAGYMVISGPFRSEERTRGFMSRLEWKKSARVQSRQSVLDNIDAP